MSTRAIRNDPEAMEEFKKEISKTLFKVKEYNTEIKRELNQLGQQWQDSHFENFSEKIRNTEQEIVAFEEGADAIIRSLERKIEALREFERVQKSI